MSLYKKQSGSWKKITSDNFYVKDGGVWKNTNQSYIKDGGTWKEIFQPLQNKLVLWIPNEIYSYTTGSANSPIHQYGSSTVFDNVSNTNITIRHEDYPRHPCKNHIRLSDMPSYFRNYSFGSYITFSWWHKEGYNNNYTGRARSAGHGLLNYHIKSENYDSDNNQIIRLYLGPADAGYTASWGDDNIISYTFYGSSLEKANYDIHHNYYGYGTSWKMATVVHDYVNKTVKVYKNSSLIGTHSISDNYSTFGKMRTANYLGGFRLFWGNGYGNDSKAKYDYWIKHIKIWDRALSSSEVSDLYNLGVNTDV